MVTTTSRDLNSLLVGAQDPGALINLTRGLSNDVSNSTPTSYQLFGVALMNLLKRYQNLGTAPYVSAQLQGQEEQAKRIMTQSEPGMPPNLQQQIRTAEAQAMNPTIQGAQQMQKTVSEQIAGVGDIIQQASNIGQWMQQQEQDKQKNALDLIFKYPDAVKQLDEKQRRDLEKQAGITSGIIEKLPSSKESWSEPYSLSSGELVQKNAKTGEIKILSKIETTNKAMDEAKTQQSSQALTLTNNLLQDDRYKAISGAWQTGWIPFTSGKKVFQQYNQLLGIMKLGARQLLKGQGQISNYEQKMLQDAITDMSQTLSEEDFKKSLLTARGVLRTNSGLETPIKVTNPETGEMVEANASGTEIFNLVSEGMIVEYK